MKDECDQLPEDDWGIQNDKIIDIAEFVINSMHKIVMDDPNSISIKELQSMADTCDTIWSLVQDILELEDNIRKNNNRDNDNDYI